MYQKFLICLVFIFTAHGLFAQKSETANLFNLGAPVASSEENLKNFLEYFPLYIENAQTVALVGYNYVGAIKNGEEARKYVKANFNGPLFAKEELVTEDQSLIFLFVEDESTDKLALQKEADSYADEYVKNGYQVYAINYVYEKKAYTYYVFIDSETNQVITEKNMFGFDVLTEHIAVINNLRTTSLRATSATLAGEIDKAVNWAVNIANDSRYGYDQTYRWGQLTPKPGYCCAWAYDCSSLVITAWQQAGVTVKSGGATYTGNMRSVFLSKGFKDVTGSVSMSSGSGTKRGDVLLNTTHHTAMVVNPGTIVQASINEKGTATGGVPGDQTGREIYTRTYYNYPWNCVLRYQESAPVGTLTLNLSSSASKNTPVSNTQEAGKTVYLWIKDNTGANGVKTNFTLTSSNTSVATIDANGKIVTKAVGTTTIKAVRNKGGKNDGATKTLTLKVTASLKLSLSSSSSTKTTVSNTQDINKTVYLWIVDNTGTTGVNTNYTLTSSNKTVATIDANGKIVTKAPGTTTIKAVRNKGGKNDGATQTLTLTVALTLKLNLSSSSTSNVSVPNTQTTGKTVYLWIVDSAGSVGTKTNFTLTSSNTAVATIDVNGKIVTKTAGTTTIKAVRNKGGKNDGATKSLTLTVTSPIPTLTLTLSSSSTTKTTIPNTQEINKTMYLWIVDSEGSTGVNTNFTLTSSSTAVATIDANGKIVTKAVGTTTIKAVRNKGGKNDGATQTMTLTVTQIPTLTLCASSSSSTKTIISNTQETGKTVYLWIEDSTGTLGVNTNYTLTSSNTAVATIDANGKITTKAVGTTTIKAVRDKGGKNDGAAGTFTLTVVAPPPTLTLSLSSSPTDPNAIVPNTQETGAIVYLWIKDNTGTIGTNTHFTYSSDDPSIASINNTGKITIGASAGTVTITAVRDGGIADSGKKDGASGTLTITVEEPFILLDGGLTLKIVEYREDAEVTDPEITSIPVNDVARLFIYDTETGEPVSCDPEEGTIIILSPDDIASISEWGTIFTDAAGELTITAINEDRMGTITIEITGAPPVLSDLTLVISSNKEDFNAAVSSIEAGTEVYLFVQENSTKSWLNRLDCILTSSDPEVAEISPNGTITTKAVGEVTFTATYNDGAGSISFEVTQPVDILTPEKDVIKVERTSTGVAVHLKGNALIELYTVNGILIDKVQAVQSYTCDLAKGVYILRINGKAQKFVK